MDETRRHDDLTAPEVRVLGCLVEKEATTPDSYPLTLNSLRLACNQSTSRDPVVAYDDREIERALASLRERGLTRTVHSPSNRATKYRHVLPDVIGLDRAETSVLAVLMLRGAQTPGELKSRTERLHGFADTDEVLATLTALSGRDRPLVRRLERRPGQKDARWTHLLAPVEMPVETPDGTSDQGPADETATTRPALASDPYGQATAEFYELLGTAHWERFGFELIELLDGIDPAAGPIVDVGAGTGVGLPYLRAAVPAARIHAVEPSKAMRTALHTRLALDPELRSIVTVDPRPVATAALPDRACALVMTAVLGHLADDERALVWRYVRDHLPAGAPAVVEVLPPDRPVEIPPTCYRRLEVGDHVYEGWQAGSPIDDRTMRWTMTYRVLAGGRLVAEHAATSRWRCWSADELRGEVEAHGLTLTEHGECVVVAH